MSATEPSPVAAFFHAFDHAIDLMQPPVRKPTPVVMPEQPSPVPAESSLKQDAPIE